MSKVLRLRPADFLAKKGAEKRCHGKFFSLSASSLPQGRGPSLACVVSKKAAPKAVQRNLVKRRCREATRACIRTKTSTPPLALVFRAKKKAVDATFADIFRDVRGLIDKVSDTRYTPL